MINFYINSFIFSFSRKKFIAAVSGGPDSMYMLNKYNRKIEAVCFVNYNKRNDTWYEEKIINEYCNKKKIDFFKYDVDLSLPKKYKDNNFQSYARKIRYDFFCDISTKINNNKLLVAHNFDDFVETAYSQIKRNSLSLFYGINQKSFYKNIIIFRPILNLKKNKIKKKCIKKNIKFNVDYTNNLDIYERNRNRKIISSMNRIEYKKLINKIFLYNIKNKSKYRKISLIFLSWKNIKYDIVFFKNIKEKYKFYIIYLFLSNNEFGRINSNKIKSILNFISNNNNDNKKFRVAENRFIYIKNGCLFF